MIKQTDTVLVVDDSPESLSLVNDTLEEAGYNVLVALEGKQALTIAKRIRPDMVLMDAVMPHKDGFDTCRELRAIPELSSVPVIFMTGLTDSDSIVRGLEAGGVDYLTKPIDPNELLARMVVHMNNARLTSSAYDALDSTGQYLFSVSPEGKTIWATPQTLALLARHEASESWQHNELASMLKSWLADERGAQHEPGPVLPLNLGMKDDPSHELAVSFVQHLSKEEALLKLVQISTAPPEDILKEKLGLPPRESQVLLWLSNGKSNWEIAKILEMRPRTVNKHLEQLFRKLEVQNRTAAARIAISLLNSE